MGECSESDLYKRCFRCRSSSRTRSSSPRSRNRSPQSQSYVHAQSQARHREPICLDDDDMDTRADAIDNDPDAQLFLEDREALELVGLDAQRSALSAIASASGSGSGSRSASASGSSSDGSRKNSPEYSTGTDSSESDGAAVVDLTGDELGFSFSEGDYLTDEYFGWLLQQWAQVGPDSGTGTGSGDEGRSEQQPQQPPDTKRVVDEVCWDGIIYKPGLSVELFDGSFLRILAVLEDDDSGEVFLRGRRLFKILDDGIDTCIPLWPQEVLWVVKDFTKDDVPLSIVKHFCAIRFTNWSAVACRDPKRRPHGRNELYCRLKQTEVPDQQEGTVEFLAPEEADDGYRYTPTLLRQIWRDKTEPFGEALEQADQPSEVIDLDASDDSVVVDLTESAPQRPQTRKYTFGDGFCGAGGISRGAEMANLHVKWGFDKCKHAMNTYRLNFPRAFCEQAEMFDFLTNDPGFLKVDVSHGSPPCQTFSSAHTVGCANDDANSACIFSCADLIRKAKPRVHTMEETSGLFERHKPVFNQVVQSIVEIGYSVRWKILNCMDYGVPQSRRRLIIIASGPGESLPQFPKPTHGLPNTGLLPYTTIGALISNIPRTAPDHDIEGTSIRGYRLGWRASFDANQPAKTITCSGGERNYHPSGKRGFTNREFASLQTFPLKHRFGAKEVRKQIGNAVPPVLAKSVYREVVRSLRRSDEGELEVLGGQGGVVEV